jgi:hypothetical protein
METESSGTENPQEETTTDKTGRPPQIEITAAPKLLQLQNFIKGVVKETFELRNTRNGTRVLTRSLVDFAAVKSYLETHNLPYFTYYPKSLKSIKAVIRHLPTNTPAQDISDGLIDLGFDIISVKQMTTTSQSTSERAQTTNLPLFLIMLSRTSKSQEIFKLTALCHIAVRVETYRAQNGLTQCHNCQQFGYVWANCKQPPRCLWCGGSHLHKECLERENAASTPACCNCSLLEGENPYPANYRGCRYAKEELQKKNTQRAPKATTGRVFSSNRTSPGVSFTAALRGKAQRVLQEPQELSAAQQAAEKQSAPAPAQPRQSGQSVRAQVKFSMTCCEWLL